MAMAMVMAMDTAMKIRRNEPEFQISVLLITLQLNYRD
jgi:hypothetical protein